MINLFITQLQALQLEGYQMSRFLRWWQHNPFRNKLKNKVGLKYTSKVKLLIGVSILVLASEILYLKHSSFLLLILATHLSFPFTLLGISLIIIKPYEMIRKKLTISHTRKTVLSSRKLTTIGITGSYGKTTTKNYLLSILSKYQETVATPESYNTTFGVAKCVALEICNKSRYFICEMDAYHQGEIKELCYQAPPQFALLISVGPQHLERLGSLSRATSANFELIDSVDPKNALVNIDNPLIAEKLKDFRYKSVKTFSLNPQSDADFLLTDFKMDSHGTTLTIHSSIDQLGHQFIAPVFGSSNLVNLTAAISMALMLKVPIKHISGGLKYVTPSPHRLQLVEINKSIVIDDSYSSNVDGFENVINDLSNQKGKKAIITPGVVELGQLTKGFHLNTGKRIADVFDHAFLVGKSDRTDYLRQGINDKIPTTNLETDINIWELCQKLSESYDWILIENDLPENY